MRRNGGCHLFSFLATHPSLGTITSHKASLPDVALDTRIIASEAFLSILPWQRRLWIREVPFVDVTFSASQAFEPRGILGRHQGQLPILNR
jgi:hypothetical protein